MAGSPSFSDSSKGARKHPPVCCARMNPTPSRRELVTAAAAAGACAAAAAPVTTPASTSSAQAPSAGSGQAPQVLTKGAAKPVVVASANGN
jgi:hypothetical protein